MWKTAQLSESETDIGEGDINVGVGKILGMRKRVPNPGQDKYITQALRIKFKSHIEIK